MAKAAKTIKKLGLSFGAEDSLLTEIEHTEGRFRISKLVPFNPDLPFDFHTFQDKNASEYIGTELAQLLNENDISTKEIAVSLDLSHLVIIQVPVDANLNDKEIKNQIEWELSQYINSPVDLYDFDHYKISISTKKNTYQLLIVGTRKVIAEFFLEAMQNAGLNLYLLDVDILAALNAFFLNYKTSPKDNIALIEVGNKKIVFTLLKNNRFLGYHIVFLNSSGEKMPTDKLVKKIKSNLRILFADYQLGQENEDFNRKYLYKSSGAVDLGELVKAGKELNFEIINPFEKIRIISRLQEEIDTFSDNSLLLEPLGLAIRF